MSDDVVSVQEEQSAVPGAGDGRTRRRSITAGWTVAAVLAWVVALGTASVVSGFPFSGDAGRAKAPAATADLFVAPGGMGDCSPGWPCGSLQDAVSRASSGQVIEMKGGSYVAQAVKRANTWTSNVVVKAAAGASVEIDGLGIDAPRLTFRGLRTTSATFTYGAHFGRFEDVVVAGPTLIISADNIAIVDSRLGPSPGNDSLKIGPGARGQHVPTNILVEGNEIGPALLTAPGQHLDAIQTHGVTNLTIRRNVIHEAASQNVNLGQESAPNSNVLVENNVIQQCFPARTECGAFWATGGGGTDVRFVRNTIKGSAYPENDSAYIGNIISYAQCTSAKKMTHNLIQKLSWDSARCSPTNVIGAPTFKPDGYHLAAGSAGVDIGGPSEPATDIDGAPRDGSPDAGADELG